MGIKVIVIEESYTSKCSFLDLEPIKKQESYVVVCQDSFEGLGTDNFGFWILEDCFIPHFKIGRPVGKRVKRGLFKASNGYVYSADVNGNLNIGRKVVGESVFDRDSIVRFVVNPLRVKSYKAC